MIFLAHKTINSQQMKRLISFFNLLVFLTFLACTKDKNENNFGVNCDSLKTGIINLNKALIRTEVNKLLMDLSPIPTIQDPNGHLENLEKVISRMEECNSLSCELNCYNCFHQLTLESLITVKTDSANVLIERTLFLNTPSDQKMSFMDIF
jgi:hypothetical protein